jgi:predicted nuclease of predicted toxin-antitoxin system
MWKRAQPILVYIEYDSRYNDDGDNHEGSAMKILLDEMCYGLEKLLSHEKWEITTVERELKKGELKSHDDGAIARYAKNNGMIIVTKDGDMHKETSYINQDCILIDDVMIARMVASVIHEKYPDI